MKMYYQKIGEYAETLMVRFIKGEIEAYEYVFLLHEKMNDCYGLFHKDLLQDDINTKDKEKSFEEIITQALGLPKELFNNKPSNKDFTG